MKRTIEQVVIAYRLLLEAKIDRMNDGEKSGLIRIMRALKPVAVGYDDFCKVAMEKSRPEGFDEIEAKMREGEQLTEKETATVNKFNADVQKLANEELKNEAELDFKPLSENALERLISGNSFSVGQIMALSEVISE